MTDDNSKIHIIQNHQPALTSGEHTLMAALDIPDQPSKHISRLFAVAGERFALKQADIQVVFPPPGSLGDHSNVLPHIILNRSTLPWERQAVNHRPDIPWLALLLFREAENPQPKVITLEELFGDNPGESEGGRALFPKYTLEPVQGKEDQVTVIDVQAELLKRILPTTQELACLAHVRQRTGSPGFAVVVGNRLPKNVGTSIVHLVSMEGRYQEAGGFNYEDAEDTDLIRLVSLYSWRFACQDEQQNFQNLLLHLSSGTLRLSPSHNADAEKYLAMGFTALPHKVRQGDATISWYHGPLVPGENQTKDAGLPAPPIQDADQLVRFNPRLGLFDVSYAAAWELGRLLALQSKAFSTELFMWKRSLAHNNQKPGLSHLTLNAATSKPAPYTPPPPIVKNWLGRLEKLEGVPFNYLVPDERLLPPESIRFFFLDRLWLEYLRDGAFSLGRTTESDYRLDTALGELYLSNLSRKVTGLLLRSDVVAGWPGLIVEGYSDKDGKSPLPLWRIDYLSKNILICLFDGELRAADIHQKTETMHFGLDEPDSQSICTRLMAVNIKLRDLDSRVICIETTNPNLIFTSAQFAAQMIGGVERVRLKSG